MMHQNNTYQYKKCGSKYLLSIDHRSPIVSSLMDFCKENNIVAGAVSGIGATNSVTLRFFDPSTKQYVDKTFNEQMEIACLVGNISQMNGLPYLHLHITLGRKDYSTLSGHLMEAHISGACELIVEQFEGVAPRTYNNALGLNMLELS